MQVYMYESDTLHTPLNVYIFLCIHHHHNFSCGPAPGPTSLALWPSTEPSVWTLALDCLLRLTPCSTQNDSHWRPNMKVCAPHTDSPGALIQTTVDGKVNSAVTSPLERGANRVARGPEMPLRVHRPFAKSRWGAVGGSAGPDLPCPTQPQGLLLLLRSLSSLLHHMTAAQPDFPNYSFLSPVKWSQVTHLSDTRASKLGIILHPFFSSFTSKVWDYFLL